MARANCSAASSHDWRLKAVSPWVKISKDFFLMSSASSTRPNNSWTTIGWAFPLSMNFPTSLVSRPSSCWTIFFQAEDGIRDDLVTGVQTCALPICPHHLPEREDVDADGLALSAPA